MPIIDLKKIKYLKLNIKTLSQSPVDIKIHGYGDNFFSGYGKLDTQGAVNAVYNFNIYANHKSPKFLSYHWNK